MVASCSGQGTGKKLPALSRSRHESWWGRAPQSPEVKLAAFSTFVCKPPIVSGEKDAMTVWGKGGRGGYGCWVGA